MSLTLREFLSRSWNGYEKIAPDAKMIHALLERRGEKVINDHVAYRTFDLPGISRPELGEVFEKWGYRKSPDDLDFQAKGLKASYWLHSDPNQPKIFISELLTERFSTELQAWLKPFAQEGASRFRKDPVEFFLNLTWGPVRFEDYERFYAESEYAAWTAAFGVQVNHFTVLVNALSTVKSLQELNELLEKSGIALASAGGVIKGKPVELLEQSSTQARKIPWKFAQGVQQPIMSVYYEFARRYPQSDGKLFQGFIPASADKIFESNFEKKS